MVDLRLYEIRKKVHHIVESLQRISTLCNPKIGEPSVNPGGHEADVQVLVAGREDLCDKIYELKTNNSGRIHAEQVVRKNRNQKIFGSNFKVSIFLFSADSV